MSQKPLRAVLAALVAVLPLGLPACEGRPKGAASAQDRTPIVMGLPSVTEIDLSRGVPELVPATLFGSTQRRTHTDLVQTLRDLQAAGSTTKGVFVRLGMAQIGLAQAHEIGRLLGEMRKQGQPVICHADGYDNASFLLAAAGCSKIWVSPGGTIEPVGLAVQLVYASRLLEKLKIDVDYLQVGKYKGANETFTRDGPSAEARASLENALKGLRSGWITAIVKGRGNEGLADMLEDGPFLPEEAKTKGIIDAVGYLEEAREDAKHLAGVTQAIVRFGGATDPQPGVSRSMVDILRAISGSGSAGTPHVAVIPAIGAITMSAVGMPFGRSDGITERDLGRLVTKLAADPSAKAVVLRVDSPGGSALASDLLWKKLMKLRESKPVVVSIGGMAASGGYYLACTATKILAEPASIIGSIGVVGGKFSLGRTLEEVGVHAEIIAASPDPAKAARAAYMSPFSPWDEPTRQRILGQMSFVYDLFVRRVAEGRNLSVEKVSESAEGRLFAGVEAQERGLVDQIGGLDDAIKLARELGKLPSDAPVELADDAPRFLELLEGEAGAEGPSSALAGSAREAVLGSLLPPSGLLGPEFGQFFNSMAPLMAGERTLAAMPFVVRVR